MNSFRKEYKISIMVLFKKVIGSSPPTLTISLCYVLIAILFEIYCYKFANEKYASSTRPTSMFLFPILWHYLVSLTYKRVQKSEPCIMQTVQCTAVICHITDPILEMCLYCICRCRSHFKSTSSSAGNQVRTYRRLFYSMFNNAISYTYV